MDKKSILKEELNRAFLDRNFLRENGLTKKEAEGKLGSRTQKRLLDELFALSYHESRFNGIKVADIVKTFIPAMRSEPVEGWAMHAYLFVRGELFPEMESEISDPELFKTGRSVYLQLLRGLYRFERRILPFDPTYEVRLLDEKSPAAQGCTGEYAKLLKLIQTHYFYEFMRLGVDITSFNTLGHMFGVHYVATLMAYQLKKAGILVDLGLISGAAIGHDVGKYGCRKNEDKRVPYLHYYYTDMCYNRFGLPQMAHIAANHSTWDLELEDLSVEALLLIYADFRVKSKVHREGGKRIEEIHFYSLKESYDVILGKLDNVDAAKKKRYEHVYAKLADFENFMIEQGVLTSVPEDASYYDERKVVPTHRDVVFLDDTQMIEEFKFRAFDHNIRLMAQINDESGFTSVIEAARSEMHWNEQRTYLNILSEYSMYLPEKLKLLTLEFFYDQLANRESDIRGQAARALGHLVATFREEYKKEIPEGYTVSDVVVTNVSLFKEYLARIIDPDPKLTEQHRDWIRNCLNVYIPVVFQSCREDCRPRYVAVLEEYYRSHELSEGQRLLLIKTLMELPPKLCTDSFRDAAAAFLSGLKKSKSRHIRIAIPVAQSRFFPEQGKEAYCMEIKRTLYGDRAVDPDEMLNTMFLDDLKVSTPWPDKVANIMLMLDFAAHADREDPADQGRLLHIATHLGNIIKVSEVVFVRLQAGDALVSLMEVLSAEQRNEIAVELFNGLEIGDFQFSRYISQYLGKILLFLSPEELEEFIDDLRKLMESGGSKPSIAVIDTFFVALENYAAYERRFREKKEVAEKRRFYLLGMLLKAFSGYDKELSQEAFWLLGTGIFESKVLTFEEKAELFCHGGRKLLSIFDEKRERELAFLNNASSLNSIYRFISQYQIDVGPLSFPRPKRVAFFPGTFDPFSRGHRAVARAIRDADFEVYLALDEFSWSKKTQPYFERRRIMRMSTAEEDHIYLFSDDVPVNIANPDDLIRMQKLFGGREVYVAVGTDVIQNASCYKAKPVPGSIHSVNHIVFARVSSKEAAREHAVVSTGTYPITGKILQLSVKKYYEDISSTRIRENINQNRDISNLIDSFAQKYIYDKNLYLREPTYKHVLQARDLSINACDMVTDEMLDALSDTLRARHFDLDAVRSYVKKPGVHAVTIESGTRTRRIIGLACAHRVDSDRFYSEFHDVELAAHIRQASGGRAAVIGLFVSRNTPTITNISQILLTEILTERLSRDYTYVVYHSADPAGEHENVLEAFKRQGFVKIADHDGHPVYAADMKAPNIIFRDVESAIKSPFNKNQHVRRAIENAHNRLLHTLTALYPGELVLSFNSSAVYNKIVSKVAGINGVSTIPDPANRKGPYMSVPFGKALADDVVPNTVTKSVHTEKYFKQELGGFRIGEMREYPSLENQAAMLHSFNRPIILIEDLLHKGYRMNKITPVLREMHVPIKAVVAGVLTGKARDRMMEENRRVECAYFIPSINLWLNERDCYPFIGGDGIDIDGPEAGHRHINLILPYAYPGFIKQNDIAAILQYSMTCLENACEIMRALEEEYQRIYEKKLTLKRLGEVIAHPKIPYQGDGIDYDDLRAPSVFLESEMKRLSRLGGRRLT